MNYRRSRRKLDLSEGKKRDKSKKLLFWIFFILLVVIMLPYYRFYSKFPSGGSILEERVKLMEIITKVSCNEYFQNTYTGIVSELHKSREIDKTPNRITLDDGMYISPYFIWDQLNKLRVNDSIYKAPNSFSLDVYRGINYEVYFRLEKMESHFCY